MSDELRNSGGRCDGEEKYGGDGRIQRHALRTIERTQP